MGKITVEWAARQRFLQPQLNQFGQHKIVLFYKEIKWHGVNQYKAIFYL